MTPDLQRLKTRIEQALNAHLPAHSDIAQPLVDAMRHAVLGGGKRIRPMLACAAAEAVGSTVDAALPPACALEFIHAYSLIHDDLPAMDDDELRHGLPATHVAFGEANAILAGDSLHSLAFKVVSTTPGLDPATRLRMIELLAEAAGWAGMAGGQCLDIAAEGMELDLPQLKALHAAKTGALIKVSVQLGALTRGVEDLDPHHLLALGEFGAKVGLAFQVVDDVLDVTQDSATLGKPRRFRRSTTEEHFPQDYGTGGIKHAGGAAGGRGYRGTGRDRSRLYVSGQSGRHGGKPLFLDWLEPCSQTQHAIRFGNGNAAQKGHTQQNFLRIRAFDNRTLNVVRGDTADGHFVQRQNIRDGGALGSLHHRHLPGFVVQAERFGLLLTHGYQRCASIHQKIRGMVIDSALDLVLSPAILVDAHRVFGGAGRSCC